MMDEKLLLSLDLQLFAKDGPTGEKTEKPTAKKIQDTRKEGQVAKSQELTVAISLLALFVLMKVWALSLGESLLQSFSYVYKWIPQYSDDVLQSASAAGFMQDVILLILKILAPILLVGFFVAFMSEKMQFKWMVSTKPMQPKLEKISPLKGIKRMFSVQTVMKFVFSLLKIAVIGVVSYTEVKKHVGLLSDLYDMELAQAVGEVGTFIINLGIKIAVILLILSMGDYVFQKWKQNQDLMMSKQDIKDEYKNAEGDPKVKSQIRAKMMQASQRRMMQELPKADVIITNPTHLAVAIKYDAAANSAPIVVAKGADYLAQKIKDVGRASGVEIVENKPLARMLYHNVEINQEIPPELYQAVAEILAQIYKLNHSA